MNYVGAVSALILLQNFNCEVSNVIFINIKEISSAGGAIKVYGKHDYIRIKHCSFYECGSYSADIDSRYQRYYNSCGGAIYIDSLINQMKTFDVSFCCFKDCYAYYGEILYIQKAEKVLVSTNNVVNSLKIKNEIISFSYCNILEFYNMNVSQIALTKLIFRKADNNTLLSALISVKTSYFDFNSNEKADIGVISCPDKNEYNFENLMFHNSNPKVLINLIMDNQNEIYTNCSFMEGINVSGKSKFYNCYFAEPTDQNETLLEPINVTFEQATCNLITEPIVYKKANIRTPFSNQFNHYSVTVEDCIFHDFSFHSRGIFNGFAESMILTRTTFSECCSYTGPAIADFESKEFSMTDVCVKRCFGTGAVLLNLESGNNASFERSSFVNGVNYSHVSFCQIKCNSSNVKMNGINQSYGLITQGVETFMIYSKDAELKSINLVGNRIDNQDNDMESICLGVSATNSILMSYFNVANSSHNCNTFVDLEEDSKKEAHFFIFIDHNFTVLFDCRSIGQVNVSSIYSDINTSLGDGTGQLVIEKKNLFDLKNSIGDFCFDKKDEKGLQTIYIVFIVVGVIILISLFVILCLYEKYRGLAYVRDRIALERSVLDDFG